MWADPPIHSSDPSLDDIELSPVDAGQKTPIHDKDAYGGVTPGGSNLPPHPPKLPVTTGPQRMTWPGFQVRGGVPTVFLELTAIPQYAVSAAPGLVTVMLKNTVVSVRNNKRALKVGYFGGAVKEVTTREMGRKGVKILIRTADKDAPEHREHVEPAAGGYQLLVIELPAAPPKTL